MSRRRGAARSAMLFEAECIIVKALGPLTLTERVARALLRWSGWRLVGTPPDVKRCVIIFAPHTSNWDFPLLLGVRFAFGKPVAYLAKDSLFRFPFAGLLRATGAIPVERTERHALVRTLTEAFRQRRELWLAMSPEGTRARTDHWKSGFYHVAREAGVPLLLAFIDASKKECGLGELMMVSGDVEVDLARLRAYYSEKIGVRPERASDIRFQSHSAADDE
jgi:1-acyl-sn-glycerol-3-phosphate acyltransferase